MAESLVSGLAEFRDGIKRGLADQRQRLKARLNEMGIELTAEIRAGAPHKSGALAATVRYVLVDTNDGERLEVLVGDKVVFYAPHVEFGTARAPAHPFVRPVVYRHEASIPRDLEQAIVPAWGGK